MPDPYIGTALFCERVLREKDDVLSAVRIVNKIIQTYSGPDAPAQMPPAGVDLQALIDLKTNESPGKQTVTLGLVSPADEPLRTWEKTVVFPDERGHGVVIHVPIRFSAQNEGCYWLHVKFNGVLITSMPLEVVFVRRPISELTTGAGS